jgi:hypothetical protein
MSISTQCRWGGAGLCWLLASAAAAADWTSGEVGLLHDGNLTQVRRGQEPIEDQALLLALGRHVAWDTGPRSAATLSGRVDTQQYRRSEGLSNARLGLGLRFDYRPSGAFFAPQYTASAQLAAWEFDSRLRDGAELNLKAGVSRWFTTRIKARVSAALNRREAESAVFDITTAALALDLDWRLAPRSTLYAGYQYRDGDFVTTGIATPEVLAAAQASAPDDALDGWTWRVEGDAHIATLGYNLGLSRHWSLDLQGQQAWAQSERGVRYERELIGASLLFRF